MAEEMAVDSKFPKRSPFKRPRRVCRETNKTKDTPKSTKGHRRRNTLHSLDALLQAPSPGTLFWKPGTSFNPYSPESAAQRAANSRSHRMPLSNSGSRYRSDFEEVELVGKGSFSQVFKCRNTVDDRIYAVKRLSRRGQERMLSSSARNVHDAAVQEVYALSSQALHPNLVSYHDAWLEDGDLFIQLEYCGASLLSRVCPEAHVSEPELLSIGVQLGHALQWLHSKGVVHRDVKPENAFEMPYGVVKLGDLGFAALDNENANGQQSEDAEGDARYLSREVLASSNECDWPKVDMFALGASLLELAQATRLPSGGEKWQSLRDEGVVLDQLPNLRDELVQMISALLHSDPAQRPEAAQVCAHLGQAVALLNEQVVTHRTHELGQRVRDLAEIEHLQRDQLDRYASFVRSCADKVDPKVMTQLLEQAKKSVGHSLL